MQRPIPLRTIGPLGDEHSFQSVMAMPSTAHCTLEYYMDKNKANSLTLQSFRDKLSLFYALSMVGTMLVAGMVLTKSENIILEITADKPIFMYIVFMIGCFGSNLFFQGQLAHITKNSSLKSQWKLFLQLCAARYVLIVGTVILGTMAFGAYDHIFYLPIPLLLILYLLKPTPIKYKVMADLELNLEDRPYF